ncbi:MAG TPA: hypothetical protein VK745_02805 [Polyangiaceae bacterium]|jgi:hypothetical protein|nr:hypothetical protein [Polyangiaceae bacterium]
MITRTASRSSLAAPGLLRAGLSVALPLSLLLAACGSSTASSDEPGASGGSNPQGSSSSAAGAEAQPVGGSSAGAGQQVGGSSSAGSGSTAQAGAGSTGQGGSSSGQGGSANGGSASTAGAANGGSAGSSSSPAGKVFSQSRFHFGTIDTIEKAAGTSMISQVDFFTSGWLQSDTFDHSGVCNDTKAGAVLANQVPVMVAYISAAHVKRLDKTMCDCNVTTSPCVASNDLCHQGAARIAADFPDIINAYKSYSTGFAQCYGTTRPIVFEMEPDWYQYTTSTESAPWTPKQAGQMLGELVAALKGSLPNARFSIDVSPWVGPNNGSDNGASWYSNFDMTQFTFVNTSGGGTDANTEKIRSANGMTWAGLNMVTGKPILADTGYGADGSAAGEDPLWDMASNINARIADGVVSISQYNPNSDWGTTISGLRSQLNVPKVSP